MSTRPEPINIEGAFAAAAAQAEAEGKALERQIARLIEPEVPTFAEVERATLADLGGLSAVVMGVPYEGYIAKDRQVAYAPGTAPLHHHDLYSRSGAFDAPNAIRQASMFYSLGHSNGYLIERGVDIGDELRVGDIGNLNVKGASDDHAIAEISGATKAVAEAGAVPLILGGDHSISYPALLGIAQATGKKIGVISLDAHLDLSWGPRFSHSSQWARAMEAGVLNPENFVLVGSRGVRNDQSWIYAARELNVEYHTMADIDAEGIRAVMTKAVERALENADAIYLSIDIDVMDPSSCPAQKYPDAGGLNTREAIQAVRIAAESRLCGMDLCCFGPAYDVMSVGGTVASRLILEGMGALALEARGARTPE